MIYISIYLSTYLFLPFNLSPGQADLTAIPVSVLTRMSHHFCALVQVAGYLPSMWCAVGSPFYVRPIVQEGMSAGRIVKQKSSAAKISSTKFSTIGALMSGVFALSVMR